jgi:hypothetical protein
MAKKHLISVFLICIFALLCGCQKEVVIEGDIDITLNQPYKSKWFEFTVKSAATATEYAGYSPEEGFILIDVLINETGAFEEPVPMGIMDFYISASGDDEEKFYPLPAFDDSMMPDKFDLSLGETAEYHMVYEVPDKSGLMLVYTEIDVTEAEGNTFRLKIN